MKTEDERRAERHQRCLADAIEWKRANPTIGVAVPVVVLDDGPREFIEGLGERAEYGTESGVTLYTTFRGRLHRVTVEDLEPEHRDPPQRHVGKVRKPAEHCREAENACYATTREIREQPDSDRCGCDCERCTRAQAWP